jgi:hypothetical protein
MILVLLSEVFGAKRSFARDRTQFRANPYLTVEEIR